MFAASVFPLARTDERPPSFGVLGIPKISLPVEIGVCLPCAGALDTRALFAVLLIESMAVRSSAVPFAVLLPVVLVAVAVVVLLVTTCLVGRLGDPTL